jgi:hypothetical protein
VRSFMQATHRKLRFYWVRPDGLELSTFWFVAIGRSSKKKLNRLFGFAYEKNEAALLLAKCTKDAQKREL